MYMYMHVLYMFYYLTIHKLCFELRIVEQFTSKDLRTSKNFFPFR